MVQLSHALEACVGLLPLREGVVAWAPWLACRAAAWSTTLCACGHIMVSQTVAYILPEDDFSANHCGIRVCYAS